MRNIILISALAATLVTQVQAAPVTFNLNGKVSSVTGALSSQLAVGDYMHFSFTYDAAAPVDPNFHGDYDSYKNSNPFNVNISSSRLNFSWASASNELRLTNDLYIGTSQF